MKPFGIFVSELIKQTSFTFKNKKSQWPWATGKVLNCGAGGTRTLLKNPFKITASEPLIFSTHRIGHFLTFWDAFAAHFSMICYSSIVFP